LTIIIYVRNIFGLATKEASHPSMMETSRAMTSAAPDERTSSAWLVTSVIRDFVVSYADPARQLTLRLA
jgi:hypothetical protein